MGGQSNRPWKRGLMDERTWCVAQKNDAGARLIFEATCRRVAHGRSGYDRGPWWVHFRAVASSSEFRVHRVTFCSAAVEHVGERLGVVGGRAAHRYEKNQEKSHAEP